MPDPDPDPRLALGRELAGCVIAFGDPTATSGELHNYFERAATAALAYRALDADLEGLAPEPPARIDRVALTIVTASPDDQLEGDGGSEGLCEQEGGCPADPDGLHHIGCGC